VDPECSISDKTVYFDGTEYEGLLNWRQCDGEYYKADKISWEADGWNYW